MDWELEQLLKVVSSIDISLINGKYHIHVFEKSGKCVLHKYPDLPWLIHKLHFEYCE